MFRAAILAGLAVTVAGLDCKPTVSGHSFDLSPLAGGADMTFSDSGQYTYKMAVCGVSAAGGDCTNKGGMVCQFGQGDGAYIAALGLWTGSPAPSWALIDESNPKKGVQLKFANGDPQCYLNGAWVTRYLNVKFNCGNGKPSTFTLTEDTATCVFTAEVFAEAACGGGGGGLSGGWVFVIIVVVCFSLYLAIGCALMHRKGAVGAERCPNLAFWQGLPGLVKEGCVYSVGKLKGKKSTNYDEL